MKHKDYRYCKVCGEPVLKAHKLKAVVIGSFPIQTAKQEFLKPASLKDNGWVCDDCQKLKEVIAKRLEAIREME